MIAPMETRRDRGTNIDLSQSLILTPVYQDGSPNYPVATSL